MNIEMLYVTTPNDEVASLIARNVIQERLAACANIIPQSKSVYRWEGEIVEEQECLLFLKTQPSRTAALIERVRQLHPYDTPCIVAYQAVNGNQDYEHWVKSETEPDDLKFA